MELTCVVESYKFRDVVKLWGRERLAHDVIVAKDLAVGIVCEGLRFQSVNPKWLSPTESFRGYPYVGYCARQGSQPIVIRADALEHLLRVSRGIVDPDLGTLGEEFVTKIEFRNWLTHTGRALPKFWFDESERYVAA